MQAGFSKVKTDAVGPAHAFTGQFFIHNAREKTFQTILIPILAFYILPLSQQGARTRLQLDQHQDKTMTSHYPARFVHFGLGKCASTFLQNVWTLDPAYTAVSLDDTAANIRKLALKKPSGNLPKFNLSVTADKTSHMVATSEGLSWGFLKSPEHQHLVPELQALSAKLIGEANVAPAALVMVRNPLDWIRACHEQSIKEGLSDNGRDFIDKNRTLIESVLDLDHISRSLTPYFERIIFLSVDHLSADKKGFWSDYSNLLNAPKPKFKTLKNVSSKEDLINKSLRSRLAHLALLNRQFSLLENTWLSLAPIPNYVSKERESFLPQYQSSTMWATRRVIEYATDDALEKLCGPISTQLEDDFSDIPIDDDLRSHLDKKFCTVLETQSTIPKSLVCGYREALKTTQFIS